MEISSNLFPQVLYLVYSENNTQKQCAPVIPCEARCLGTPSKPTPKHQHDLQKGAMISTPPKTNMSPKK